MIICYPLFSQKSGCHYSITGTVVDSSTMMPLEVTNIAIVGEKSKATSTDKNGSFTLNYLCKGQIELHISHLQCDHIHIQLIITKDTSIVIYLKHSEHVLDGYKAINKNENIENISQLNAKSLQLNKGSSISELMQNIGGITLLKTGSTISKPIVNGLHSNRVILLNNGIRQEGQNWGMEHAPEIDAFLATEIELLKGAEALRYAADGIGGVIMIKPPSIYNEKSNVLKGELNLVGMSNGRGGVASLILGSKVSEKIPVYFRMQGTAKKSGNYNTPDYYLSNTGFEEYNFSLALGYKLKNFRSEFFYSSFNNIIGIFKGSHIGNLHDLLSAFKSDTPLVQSGFTYTIDRPYQKVKHQLLKANCEFLLRRNSKFQISLAYQKDHREEYDILRSLSSFKGPSFNYFINTLLADITFLKTDLHKLNFTTGCYGIYQTNSYTGRYLIPGFYNKGFATYFLADKTFNKMKLEGALRYDYKLLTSYLWSGNVLNEVHLTFNNATYLLQVIYHKNKQMWLTVGTSSAWRPPAPNELYSNGLHQGAATIEVGDSTLRPERSFNYICNFKYTTKSWYFESELYYKRINGFINLVPSMPPQMTIRGAFPVYKYIQNDVDLKGLNLLLRKEFKRNYYIKLNSNILIASYRNSPQPLSQMPPISGKLWLGKGNKKYMAQVWCNATAKQFRYDEGTDYVPPPKGFVLFGADASYEFIVKHQAFIFNLSINNLFNTSYREYLNRFRYFADEQGFGLTARLIVPININYKK